MSQAQLLLFSRADCHLCDQAEILINALLIGSPWQLTKVDIDNDPALRQRYQTSIPVLLRCDNQQALNWPFPQSRVRSLLDLD
ncbi:MAG: glutaredoxin family protein [Pseudomonadales bacterium]|jgi:hypothetical protein|nr:glutaredoxin family protein [Pseudomonadales bacterium]